MVRAQNRFRPSLEGLEDRTVPTALAADLAPFGVFRLSTTGAATPLNPTDADHVAIAPNGDVVANIPSVGVVLFPAAGGASKTIFPEFFPVTDVAVTSMVTGGVTQDTVVIAFSFGVFKFFPNGAATQVTTMGANAVAIAQNGDVLASLPGAASLVLFPGSGGPAQILLSGLTPTDVALSSAATGGATGATVDTIVASFGTFGVFSFDPTTHAASQITTAVPTSIGLDAAGDVVGAFPTFGVFLFPKVGSPAPVISGLAPFGISIGDVDIK